MELLGRCLGPTRNNDNAMCQAILHMNEQMIPHWSLHRLRLNELAPSNKYEAHNQSAFDAAIRKNLGNSMTPPRLTPKVKPQTLSFVPDDDEQQGSDFLLEVDTIDATGRPVNHQYITHLLVNSEVILYQVEEQR